MRKLTIVGMFIMLCSCVKGNRTERCYSCERRVLYELCGNIYPPDTVCGITSEERDNIETTSHLMNEAGTKDSVLVRCTEIVWKVN